MRYRDTAAPTAASRSPAQREQEARERLEAIGLRPLSTLVRALQRRPNGTRIVAEGATSELLLGHEAELDPADEALLATNAAALLAACDETAVEATLAGRPDPAALARDLKVVHAEASERARQARQKAERWERAAQGEGGGVLDTLGFKGPRLFGFVKTAVERADAGHKARKARLLADTLDTAVELVASAQVRVEQRRAQRDAIEAAIAGARERSQAHLDRLTANPAVGLRPGDNDLPPGYATHLGRALAGEEEAVARQHALRELRAALAAAEAEGEPLTAERLFEALLETAALPESAAPRTLEAAVGTVAVAWQAESRQVWRAVLAHLAGPAFAQAPAVRLSTAAERSGYAFRFQVLPDGQPLAVSGSSQEVKEARFSVGPTARLALMRVRTGFDLGAVQPVQELQGALQAAAARANPYLLPARVREAAPQPPTTPPGPAAQQRPASGESSGPGTPAGGEAVAGADGGRVPPAAPSPNGAARPREGVQL